MKYEVDERFDQTSDILPHWMAAHVHLKNEFTEDEMHQNLMRWLSYHTSSASARSLMWGDIIKPPVSASYINYSPG